MQTLLSTVVCIAHHRRIRNHSGIRQGHITLLTSMPFPHNLDVTIDVKLYNLDVTIDVKILA